MKNRCNFPLSSYSCSLFASQAPGCTASQCQYVCLCGCLCVRKRECVGGVLMKQWDPPGIPRAGVLHHTICMLRKEENERGLTLTCALSLSFSLSLSACGRIQYEYKGAIALALLLFLSLEVFPQTVPVFILCSWVHKCAVCRRLYILLYCYCK